MLSDSAHGQRTGCSVSRSCITEFLWRFAQLIRNLLGTGSPLAFPGSMVGAFVSAMIFKYTRSKIGAYLGEVIGTGILGGMLCYPIASMMMGQKAALFTFVGPFLASTLCGTVIAAVIITALYKSKAVRLIEEYID